MAKKRENREVQVVYLISSKELSAKGMHIICMYVRMCEVALNE